MPWQSGREAGYAPSVPGGVSVRDLSATYDMDPGYSRGEQPEPEEGGGNKVLSPTKARVARGLQDLLIDLKEMKADNRRLEDLLRMEQRERTNESGEYMRARQAAELQIKAMEDEMRTCLQELKWSQLELKRSITTSTEANRPASVSASGPIDESPDALGWGITGELAFSDEDNPAKQVHNHIKIVNELAKKVKEEIQSLVGMNADLKWEKAKAEVTAKAYCTELLTTKKNNATKKMRAQLCRWHHHRLAKGFATWVYWHTQLAKEMVRKKRTLLEEDVRMLTDDRDRLERNLEIMTGHKDAQEARADMFASLLDSSIRSSVDFETAPAGIFNPNPPDLIAVPDAPGAMGSPTGGGSFYDDDDLGDPLPYDPHDPHHQSAGPLPAQGHATPGAQPGASHAAGVPQQGGGFHAAAPAGTHMARSGNPNARRGRGRGRGGGTGLPTNQSGAAVKASMMEKTHQFKAAMAKTIKDEKKMENAKRLMAHFKYVHQQLKTRVFVGWANHIRALQKQLLQAQILKEQDRAREAGKKHSRHGKEMQATLEKEQMNQEEGKVRYYQAAVRRTLLRCRFFQWVEMLYQQRIVKVENLLQLEFDQRQQMEREKRELENELEEVYLGKARAEAERDECMAALRQHREKEEMDMNRLLEEVGYLKAEVYAS